MLKSIELVEKSTWKRINTKEELITLLKKYKGILTNPMIEYLNSLIELEFSVIRENISDCDRIALSELEVYKRIAKYNIYNRALNLFNEQNVPEIQTYSNKAWYKGLNVYYLLGEQKIPLFDFNYEEKELDYELKTSGFKTMNIGTISLYQTLDYKEELINKLKKLCAQQNPHRYTFIPYIVGGPASKWEIDHEGLIRSYEKELVKLDSRKELTAEEKKEIEVRTRFFELLLEDYGLTNEDFIEESSKNSGNSSLQKTLIKKIPNLTINNNIKYI